VQTSGAAVARPDPVPAGTGDGGHGGGSAEDLAAWNANADRYAAASGGATDSVARRLRSFLHSSLGDVSGLDVLDLGCGTGWLAAEVADLGGRVVGVDGSDRLLQIARAQRPDIEFVQADLTTGLPDLGRRRFDRVLAQMVLMDMPELDCLLQDIGQCLLPNGRFIFTIPHPALDRDDPGPYLHERTRWITTFGGHRHYHRPLGWYVNLLATSGLAVVRMFEDAGTTPGPARVPAAGDAPGAGGAVAPPAAEGASDTFGPLLGLMTVPVTPGLPLPVGRPSTLVADR
jgi:SAM-dependent methyltransferase